MKKSLLLILASLFAIFALAGCAEEEKNDTPAATVSPVDLNNPASLVGVYEITFFYTDGAKLVPLSSNCADVSKYVDKTITDAIPQAKCGDTQMKGYGQITMDMTKGTGKLVTKIQMTGKSMTEGPLAVTLKPQQYNYTEFSEFTASSITAEGINVDKKVKGTSGRDLEKLITPTKEPAYPAPNNSANTDYSFTVDKNDPYTLINNMVDRSNYMEANVVVRMKKLAELPAGYTMDKNTAFPEPVIEGFVSSPK